MNFRPLTLASLALSLAGCSSPTTGPAFKDGGVVAPGALPASAAVLWTVSPGSNGGTCGGLDDTFSIGSPEASTIVTVPNGGSYNGFPITVRCTVSPDTGGYSVSAEIEYGSAGTLSIAGQVNVVPGAPSGVQTGILGTFDDHIRSGVVADMSDSNCTITFTSNPNMGIGAGRIWGVIDCPNAAGTGGRVCDGNAEFLLENCGY